MKNRSLKFKIFLIFSFPLIAFFYFSYLFMHNQYNELNNITIFKLSTNVTNALNNLLHNLQIERGLSAGYIVRKNKPLHKTRLTAQYAQTDAAYKKVLLIIEEDSENKTKLKNLVGFKAKPTMLKVIKDLNTIQNIRQKVLNAQISFKEEMNYYTNVNKNLILSIKIFNTVFKDIHGDAIAIAKLQELKEYAGLERAYIYNQILANFNDKHLPVKLKELQNKQLNMIEEFLTNASINSTQIYKNYQNAETIKLLELCREGVLNKTMKISDADKCFNASSAYLDIFANISIKMLNNYKIHTSELYDKSLHSLYFTIFIWILSLIAIIILAYILIRFINKEEYTMQELRIASYAFNAQEAITITNVDGMIIRVNNAFTKITGYSAKEAIGQNPRFLKSTLHSEEFFKNMWDELLKHGSWQGEIYNQRKNTEVYPEMLSITAIKDDDNITTHYIGQFLDITDIKEAKELAQYQADHDFLTGLLNRKSLIERVNEEFIKAKRHQLIHAFLFIDLDNFKSINDNYGHDVGDQLIIETSKRISSVLRAEDIAARISGDEFGIMIVNLGDTEAKAALGVKQVCKKILDEMSHEFTIYEHKLHITLSIGVKVFPDYEKSVQDIMVHADKAMYEAKKQGKNKYMFFNRDIENELKAFVLLEKEIKESIDKNDFIFYYQPKVSVSDGSITGAELLVRWQHPTKGLLYPDSFISVAEEIGVIDKFSTLALQSACNFIKSNENIFDGTLAINISSQELLHPNFENKIISLITHNCIKPEKIELEITESMIIEKFDLAIEKIKRLQDFGIQFSIDDFGTGYSSITYLQKLPVNKLKIDRWFLQNIEEDSNKELIKMIANIGKTFKMEIIAEGIETQAQLEFVKNIQIESYQGYYFSKAIDEQSFKELL